MFLPYWPTIATGLVHIVMQEPPSAPPVPFSAPKVAASCHNFSDIFQRVLGLSIFLLNFLCLKCMSKHQKSFKTPLPSIVSGLMIVSRAPSLQGCIICTLPCLCVNHIQSWVCPATKKNKALVPFAAQRLQPGKTAGCQPVRQPHFPPLLV